MIFTHYTSSKAFSDDALEILNHHEIQNNLLYKNIGDEPNKIMMTVKDNNGKILLTATRTIPFPMVMYETDNIRNDEVVSFFAKSLLAHNIDVDFIMTEKALAKSFCEIYGKLLGRDFYCNESLVLYVINKVNELPEVNGNFSMATEKDMYYLPYWWADFAPACNIGEYHLASGIEDAQKAITNRNVYLWKDNSPVSVAAVIRQTSNCSFIGQVYTPPHLRGKGYSTACVGQLTKMLLDDGCTNVALYADCANPYSNRVYQKIGYQKVFWYDQYKV